MAHRVCPWWLGYLLASPLRRIVNNPRTLLAPYVSLGMTVLEPDPGMGFYTLELASLVGPSGKVGAVDVQPKMIQGLKRRAAKAGLLTRVDAVWLDRIRSGSAICQMSILRSLALWCTNCLPWTRFSLKWPQP